jgi:hypothetical protein
MAKKSPLELKNKCSLGQKVILHRQAKDLSRRDHIVVDHMANKLALL